MPQADWARRPLGRQDVAKLMARFELMTIEEFAVASEDMRRAAFAMAKVNDGAVLNRIKTQLQLYVKQGWDAQKFAGWLEGQGAQWHQSYSRLVFRNATQNAYNMARYTIQQRTGNKILYPILIYDSTMDSETTDFCKFYNNKWWLRHQFPAHLYPPNHHNCRARTRMGKKSTGARLGDSKRVIGVDQDGPITDWPDAPPDGWLRAIDKRKAVYERGLGL